MVDLEHIVEMYFCFQLKKKEKLVYNLEVIESH